MDNLNIVHRYRHSVIYAETDRMNVVYYSRYYEFFEAARSAFLRDLGFAYAEMEKEGFLLPVIESHCRYLRPATFEDVLTIETHLNDLPKVKLRLDYRVFKDDPDKPVAIGYTVHSFVNRKMKPVRAASRFLASLERFAGKQLGAVAP